MRVRLDGTVLADYTPFHAELQGRHSANIIVKFSRASGPTVVDLFAGAGLFSYAFSREKFRVISAVEFDQHAAATYARNLGSHVIAADVRTVKPSGRCDVIVAGPPCQGFSSIGKRSPRDSRNYLGLVVAQWAKVLRPSVVVIENVAPFLRSPVWRILTDRLVGLGYDVQASVLNAADFGVPQRRKRSFTVASRVGMVKIEPNHDGIFATVREAWEGLPKTPNGKNYHVAPAPSGLAMARMRVIPAQGDRDVLLRRAPHLASKSWFAYADRIKDVWGRLRWDEPSGVIRTAFQNPSKGRHIHPEQNRVISLREGARLQSIPDSWEFSGCATHVARQIGNGVPPLMGRAVARAVMRTL